MLSHMSVLIVGASVAGIRTAQSLRMNGYSGDIVILGAETHHPYDKPPLSKETLGDDDPAPVPLLSAEDLAALRVDLRLGVAAVALDTHQRTVTTSAGDHVSYETLVIATGVAPRVLPGCADIDGVFTLRTADDAIQLRHRLIAGSQVVVVGAGFIGAEFATAARKRGLDVVIVEAQHIPMAHILGSEVGRELGSLHALNGVSLRTGVTVAAIRHQGGRVSAVELSDGTLLPADVVVVGIGSEPATGWLEGSGLQLSNGVLCDANLRVIGTNDIYAAGDVARWESPWFTEPVRIEHWTNANEHAAIVAASITGMPAPSPQVPYVWSDQYGRRIQIVGRPAAGVLHSTAGAVDGDSFIATYVDDQGTVIGGLVINDPRTFMKIRKAVAGRARADDLDVPIVSGATT